MLQDFNIEHATAGDGSRQPTRWWLQSLGKCAGSLRRSFEVAASAVGEYGLCSRLVLRRQLCDAAIAPTTCLGAPPQRNWTQSKECRRVPLPHIHLLYERHMVRVAQMLLQTCFHCERRVAMNQHEGSAEYEDARCGLTSCQAPHCRPLQIGICWLHKCLNRQIIVNVSRYLLNAFYQSHVVLIEQPSSFWLHAGSLMSAGSSFPHASSAFSSIPSSFLTLASAHAYVLSLLWWVALPACPELATDAHNSVTYTVSGAWRQSIWQTAHNRNVIIVYLLWANQSTHPNLD